MVITDDERRVAQRHPSPDYSDSRGRFFMLIDEAVHEINDIYDVSFTGVRILSDTFFSNGTQFFLSYIADDLDIAIQAEIVWSKREDDSAHYMTGIKFNPVQPDLNTLFFMVFRKQLDGFSAEKRLLQV